MLLLLFQIAKAWDYTYHGLNWEQLCKIGVMQSPIDIHTDKALLQNNGQIYYAAINLQYQDAIAIPFQTQNVLDLQGEFGSLSFTSQMSINSTAYKVAVHQPSEHFINGKRYDLEIQIFHYDAILGTETILSILYKTGEYNRFIDQCINAFNNNGSINLDNAVGGISQLQKYYAYYGSKTTPSCQEKIRWVLLPEIQQISQSQYNFFRNKLAYNASLSMANGNYRLLQPINERPVLFMNGTNHYNKVYESGIEMLKYYAVILLVITL